MKFLRVFGIILMVFNGITVFVLAVSASNLVKGMEGTLAENIVTTILMIAIFCGAFYGSYWIYLAGNPEKHAKRRQSKAAARYDRQIKKTEKKYAKQAARTEDASQAENASKQSDNNNVTINESSGETSGEAAPKVKEFFTVIAPYLELPYHDGDNFFLFETSGDAERFVRDSGRNDLKLRKLSDIKERTEYEANLGAELAEYFCCGYKGAKICGSDGSETVRTIDELLDEYNGRGNYGSIVPDAVRKVHNYLKQMDYSFRKYGPDMNSYPDFWKKHLNDYKHYAAESIAMPEMRWQRPRHFCAGIHLSAMMPTKAGMKIDTMP